MNIKECRAKIGHWAHFIQVTKAEGDDAGFNNVLVKIIAVEEDGRNRFPVTCEFPNENEIEVKTEELHHLGPLGELIAEIEIDD